MDSPRTDDRYMSLTTKGLTNILLIPNIIYDGNNIKTMATVHKAA